ncbi:pentapeptide repeat-containing protein [Nocardia sp. NBC_01329]|uniref:pentapeptide repeat-containing protein n=1 Tax=Nocardia sp. NBC_01329 TaxID=2903594 RepID=UPI002E112B86|nr:pentapeptide repeat-containing protein [Nocardia sp. NBC_01329]
MPRELTDLPFANLLEPAGEIDIEGEYDCLLFDNTVLSDPDARHTVFDQCAFRSAHLDGGSARGARFSEVWLHGVRITGTDLADAVWMDTEVVEGAWSGVEASGAELRRVEFHNCKLDSVNFRGANLTKVRFVDCVLRHVDFGGAKLNEVDFPGSEISALVVRDARLTKVDFRGAAALRVDEGVDALRGAIVTPGQLLDLAPAFAASVGLLVQPE